MATRANDSELRAILSVTVSHLYDLDLDRVYNPVPLQVLRLVISSLGFSDAVDAGDIYVGRNIG